MPKQKQMDPSNLHQNLGRSLLEEQLEFANDRVIKQNDNQTTTTKTIMLLRNLAIVAALCATSIQGFAPSATSMRVQTARNLMSAEEVKSIMDEAESCSKGECAIDEVEDLISSLLTQQSLLSKRIAEIDGLVKDLEHVNGRDERPTDEIRETVRAIFRIFALGDKASGNDYPSLSKPTGYSGEVAGGGKTAYDVLPPKPIKK